MKKDKMGKKNTSKKQNPSTEVGGDTGNKNQNTGKVITNSRFSKAHSDPRFQKLSKHKAKVTIDPRFSRMFTDKRFSASTAPQDKRGKHIKNLLDSDLRRYYRLEEEEKDKKEIEDVEVEKSRMKASLVEDSEESQQSAGENSSDSETEEELKSLKLKNDDEEEDEEDSDDERGMESDTTDSITDIDEDDMDLGEDASDEVENVPIIEKETSRLAVVNMDWTHVKASDLFVILSSTLPQGGQILSVTVYPSEFGLKRMEEEAVRGPVALFGDDNKKEKEEEDSDDEEINNEKLRNYEISRLRYYYAVVECDSVTTADYIYRECDGVEVEGSSNKLDLRFIPDDMEFKHPPRDQCTEAPSNYKGLEDFSTRALQHTDMKLSWDEDEPHRVKNLRRKFDADQLAEMELKEFLASDESDSEDDGENGDAEEHPCERKSKKLEMYLSLIQSGNGSDEEEGEEDEDQEMEVTFNTGLEDISKKILEKKDKKSETVWEKYLRERKEKKKAKKNRSKDSSDDESEDSDQASIEEPDDFFEEEPQVTKSKKGTDKGKKTKTKKNNNRGETENVETDKEAEASRAELELLLVDDKGESDKIKGYKIKRAKGGKGKKKNKEAPAEDKLPNIDLDDQRFSALGSNPLFALDPTDPQFKRSTTYVRQLAKQQQKTREDLIEEEKQMKLPAHHSGVTVNISSRGEDEPSKGNLEMASSVKSLKMKLKQSALGKHKPESSGGSSSRKKMKLKR